MPNEPDHKPVLHTKKHIARLERERRQTRLILYAFLIVLVAVVGLLGYGYVDQSYLQLRRPVASVGENEISLADFEARVRLQRQQLISNYSVYLQYQQFGLDVTSQLQQIQSSLDLPVSIGESVLNQMIDEELVRQEAAARGIQVGSEELEAAIRANFDFFPGGTPTASMTPTTVVTPTIPPAAFAIVSVTPTLFPTIVPTATFAAIEVSTALPISPTTAVAGAASPTAAPTATALPTATPLTEAGFQERLTRTLGDLTRMGFSEAQFRKFMETQYLREKLFEVLTADVAPVQEQVWARHILVEEEVVAAAVRDRLTNGEDFATLAAEVSKDPASGVNGGDLGWFARGVMVDAFEQVAFTLQPGELSAPVKSDFGWHVIQVIARQDRPYTHDEYERARQAAFQDWLSKAREEYGVVTFDDWKERVPTEPSFASMATEAVFAGQTALADESLRTEAPATPAAP